MRSGLIFLTLFLLFFGATTPVLSQVDTAARTKTPWRYYVRGGAGWMYENVTVITSGVVSHGALTGELRTGSMFPQGGTDGNWLDLPREQVADLSVLVGYGAYGQSAFGVLSIGPTFAYGILRGNVIDSTLGEGGFFVAQPTRTHEQIVLAEFGITAQLSVGFLFNEYAGIGARIFYTRASTLSFAGGSLDFILGKLN